MFLLHSSCGQLMVSYDKLWTLIMLGYRLAKSSTTTLKWMPAIGSTTSPPRYFFSFITAVVDAVPFASSSFLFGISSFLCRCSKYKIPLIHWLTPKRAMSSTDSLPILAITTSSFISRLSLKLVSLNVRSASLRQYSDSVWIGRSLMSPSNSIFVSPSSASQIAFSVCSVYARLNA